MSTFPLDEELPRLARELLLLAEFQLAAFVERFVDDRGPARGQRSTSAHWGLQSGRASRSLVPGQPDNIAKISTSGGRLTLEYGSRVPYFQFLEQGTKNMIARPALEPGLQAFLQEQWPKLVNDMIDKAVRVFNG